jgi:hypothetical protein
MKSAVVVSALAAAVHASPAKRTTELEPITVKGNAFFKGDERFYVRGIDYQPGGSGANVDPLADTEVCLQDIEKFKKLGVNVIRVYSTDNSLDHDDCMNALSDAGIYAMLDANNPRYSINRDDPHGSYNTPYLQSVFATIDAFAKYSNTMAFFSGNEVIHDLLNTTLTAPYVKATDRDMRAYIKARGYRKILVGYSAADVTTNYMQTAHYFNCGNDEERSDFFAFNDYAWCSTDFEKSGWDKKVKEFEGYGIPLFLSEYGCIHNTRNFGEVEALMHSNMTHVYSGGLMYEYSMEPNKFGIVKIKDGDKNGGVDQTGDREELKEFKAYADALKKWPAPKGDGGYSTENKASTCPERDEHWDVDPKKLPLIPEGAKKFMTQGAGAGPGLMGDGSQWAVDQASSSEADTGTTSSSTESGTADDKSAAVRGSIPVFASGLAVLLTLAVAL